jgi:hypothetical protein
MVVEHSVHDCGQRSDDLNIQRFMVTAEWGATLRTIVWARRCTSLAFKVLLRWGVKEMDGLHSGWIRKLDTELDPWIERLLVTFYVIVLVLYSFTVHVY